MKKQIALLLLLFGLTTSAQSLESLKIATRNLYEANYLMDFEAIASYSYPKIKEVNSEALLLETIEKQFENAEFRLRLQLETVPFHYGEIRKIEGKLFCVITFRNPMRYFFETQLTAAKAAEKASWLKEINKTKEVTFEPKRNSFNVRKTSTYVAVFDEITGSTWKFFNLDDVNQDTAFRTIFSQSVQKELSL